MFHQYLLKTGTFNGNEGRNGKHMYENISERRNLTTVRFFFPQSPKGTSKRTNSYLSFRLKSIPKYIQIVLIMECDCAKTVRSESLKSTIQRISLRKQRPNSLNIHLQRPKRNWILLFEMLCRVPGPLWISSVESCVRDIGKEV